jgi:cation diffusion facilitator family transporter
LAVNVVFTLAKGTAGILGHSQALIADAVESLADIFSSLVVWRGLVIAAEPADADHPYGHGKAEPIASAVVAVMLLLAAGWIAVESVRGIIDPHQVPAWYTLVVLGVVIAVKETLFRFVLQESLSVESVAVRTDAWHHRSDAITSLAAAIGISVALVGGPRYAGADDVAALFAAAVIVWNGLRLLRGAMHELMDTAPGDELVQRVRELAGGEPGVSFVEKCFVRKMGWQYFVDMHLQVDPAMTVKRAHDIAHAVKDKIRTAIPSVRDVLVHIEPYLPPPSG